MKLELTVGYPAIVRAIADRCPLWSMTFGEKTSISFGRVRLSSTASDFLQRTAMT